MLVMIRAPHEEVVSALARDGVGAISPTSGSGWTAAWVPDRIPLRALGDQFVIDDDAGGILRLEMIVDGRCDTWSWAVDDAEEGACVRDDAARALCDMLTGADRPSEFRRVLKDAQVADDVVGDLLEVCDLPRPWGPVPRREITLQHGDPVAARMAARIAAGEIGMTRLARLTDEWSVIRADDGPDAQQAVTKAVAAGRTSRRVAVLALWRGDGAAAGFELMDRTGVRAQGRWNTGWRDLAADTWEARDAGAAALAASVGGGRADLVALRALVRARTWPGDPLAELGALLGIPSDALTILDRGAAVPELTPVEPAPFWRMFWEAVADSGPRVTTKWLRVAITVYCGVMGAVALGAAVVKYAVWATDGAFLDRDGAATSDLVFAILYTVGASLNLWIAVRMGRRGTFV